MSATAGRRRPLSPAAVGDLLGGLSAPWWIAGGWALDLYAGRRLRRHEDIDVAVLRHDLGALAGQLDGWELHAAVGPGELRRWHGEALQPHVHELWARPGADEPWACEFLLEDALGDEWRFRRDPRVRLPVGRLGALRDGLPLLAPEVALLYKAKAPDATGAADLAAVLPLLDESRRAWLAAALHLAHPGHEWIERL